MVLRINEIKKRDYSIVYYTYEEKKLIDSAQVDFNKEISKKILLDTLTKLIKKLFDEERFYIGMKRLKEKDEYFPTNHEDLREQLERVIDVFANFRDGHSIEIIDRQREPGRLLKGLQRKFKVAPIHKNAIRLFLANEPSIMVEKTNCTQDFIKKFIKFFK